MRVNTILTNILILFNNYVGYYYFNLTLNSPQSEFVVVEIPHYMQYFNFSSGAQEEGQCLVKGTDPDVGNVTCPP